jgi:uncharacterized membrane protein YfcA
MAQAKQSTQAKNKSASKIQNYNGTLLFDKQNYLLMGVCIVLVIIGFVLMSGGKSPNLHEFHPEELYSFRRVTLAPIVILIGFGVGIYSIIRKHSNEE